MSEETPNIDLLEKNADELPNLFPSTRKDPKHHHSMKEERLLKKIKHEYLKKGYPHSDAVRIAESTLHSIENKRGRKIA